MMSQAMVYLPHKESRRDGAIEFLMRKHNVGKIALYSQAQEQHIGGTVQWCLPGQPEVSVLDAEPMLAWQARRPVHSGIAKEDTANSPR